MSDKKKPVRTYVKQNWKTWIALTLLVYGVIILISEGGQQWLGLSDAIAMNLGNQFGLLLLVVIILGRDARKREPNEQNRFKLYRWALLPYGLVTLSWAAGFFFYTYQGMFLTMGMMALIAGSTPGLLLAVPRAVQDEHVEHKQTLSLSDTKSEGVTP